MAGDRRYDEFRAPRLDDVKDVHLYMGERVLNFIACTQTIKCVPSILSSSSGYSSQKIGD